MTDRELKQHSISFRMGYVESSHAPRPKRDCYLLQSGAKDAAEYERGFQRGLEDRKAAKKYARPAERS